MCRINIIFRPFISFCYLSHFPFFTLFPYLSYFFTWIFALPGSFSIFLNLSLSRYAVSALSISYVRPFLFLYLSHFLSFPIFFTCLIYLSHFLSFPIVFTCLIFYPFPFPNTRRGGKSLMHTEWQEN